MQNWEVSRDHVGASNVPRILWPSPERYLGYTVILCLCRLDSSNKLIGLLCLLCSKGIQPRCAIIILGSISPKFQWFPAQAEAEFVSSLKVQRRSRRGLSGTVAIAMGEYMADWMGNSQNLVVQLY